MLDSFASRLARSAPLRHVLFLVAALLAVWGTGYHFGTFDQIVHIPYLLKGVYPELYPNDDFLNLRFYHYSFFWFAFEPFVRLGVLEIAVFVVHLLSTYFTFWMAWELSITLFKNPLTALFTQTAFIFPHLGLPGFTLIEFCLLNRNFVLPFLMLAMVLYLKRRYRLAYLILGLMYNLHAISATFVLAMFLLDSVLRWRQVGWRNMLVGLMLFVIGAWPVLFWKTNHSPIDFSLRPDVLDVSSRAMLATIYYMFLPQPFVIMDTLNGVGTLGLFLAGRKHAPSGEHDRPMTHFVYAVGVILLVQVITTYWLPITIILQFQILRAATFLLLFGYLYFANLLARIYQESRLDLDSFAVLLGAFIVSVVPVVPCLIWLARRWLAGRRWLQLGIQGTLAVGMIAGVLLARQAGLYQPGFHLYGPDTEWVEVQRWARDNTPQDARFITPPHLSSFYVPDWRVFSQRSTIATLPEVMEIPFAPDYLSNWQSRFESVAPGAVARFNYNYGENQAIAAEAYYSLSLEEVRQVARQYGASYLVVEKPHTRDLPVVYENEGFIVYDLRGMSGE